MILSVDCGDPDRKGRQIWVFAIRMCHEHSCSLSPHPTFTPYVKPQGVELCTVLSGMDTLSEEATRQNCLPPFETCLL